MGSSNSMVKLSAGAEALTFTMMSSMEAFSNTVASVNVGKRNGLLEVESEMMLNLMV